MTQYRVKKDFPSRSTQIFREGEVINLPKSTHPRAKMLLENGFIEKLINFSPRTIAISKLAKVEIADHDYVEGYTKHFTWDEAMEIEKKLNNGWRLPTRSEWVLICEEFGQKNEQLSSLTLSKALNLRYAGYCYKGVFDFVGTAGYYWSRTPSSDASAYYLSVNSNSFVDSDNDTTKPNGFSVRLVRDVDFGIGSKC